jgi:hypothetical protein
MSRTTGRRGTVDGFGYAILYITPATAAEWADRDAGLSGTRYLRTPLARDRELTDAIARAADALGTDSGIVTRRRGGRCGIRVATGTLGRDPLFARAPRWAGGGFRRPKPLQSAIQGQRGAVTRLRGWLKCARLTASAGRRSRRFSRRCERFSGIAEFSLSFNQRTIRTSPCCCARSASYASP